MRSDGLLDPATVEESYLAAILDELRGLRQDLLANREEIQGAQDLHINVDDLITKVKEPEKPLKVEKGKVKSK